MKMEFIGHPLAPGRGVPEDKLTKTIKNEPS